MSLFDGRPTPPLGSTLRRIRRLADEVLPARAASDDRYPVQEDHCFRRIAYDVAVGARWDEVLARPFHEHARPDHIRRALTVLEEMVEDPATARTYNRQSLRYRERA